MAKVRKPIQVHLRKKAVADWRSGKHTAIEIAKSLKVSATAVYQWRDAEESKKGLKHQHHGRANGASPKSGVLPMKTMVARKPSAKALVPVSFQCPHCGGAISV